MSGLMSELIDCHVQDKLRCSTGYTLKHLHKAETRFYCLQALLRDQIPTVRMTFLSWNRRSGIEKSFRFVQDCKLEAILVLRIQDGNDIFVSVGGKYHPSFFGVALQRLSTLPRWGRTSSLVVSYTLAMHCCKQLPHLLRVRGLVQHVIIYVHLYRLPADTAQVWLSSSWWWW